MIAKKDMITSSGIQSGERMKKELHLLGEMVEENLNIYSPHLYFYFIVTDCKRCSTASLSTLFETGFVIK